jgi:hypothetical protein
MWQEFDDGLLKYCDPAPGPGGCQFRCMCTAGDDMILPTRLFIPSSVSFISINIRGH